MAFKSKFFEKLIASSHENHTYCIYVDAMHERETIAEHKKGHCGNVRFNVKFLHLMNVRTSM
jgi:hypothetical protein